MENLTLTGTAAINVIGNGLANVIIGNNASNQSASGTGNEIFKFIAEGPNDKVTDYNVANDTVQLVNTAFTALTTAGTLNTSQFRIWMRMIPLLTIKQPVPFSMTWMVVAQQRQHRLLPLV